MFYYLYKSIIYTVIPHHAKKRLTGPHRHQLQLCYPLIGQEPCSDVDTGYKRKVQTRLDLRPPRTITKTRLICPGIFFIITSREIFYTTIIVAMGFAYGNTLWVQHVSVVEMYGNIMLCGFSVLVQYISL